MAQCMPALACDFWSFLRAGPQPWPLVHLIVPFSAQYLINNVWVVISLMLINEQVEWAAWGTAHDNPALLFGTTIADPEPIGDSIIGDPVVGFVGVLLAVYARYVFDVPPLLPGGGWYVIADSPHPPKGGFGTSAHAPENV